MAADSLSPFEIVNDAVADVARAHTEWREELYRRVILGTDWREPRVVRIVFDLPTPYIDHGDNAFTISTPDFDVRRYGRHAPPLSEHRSKEVVTITLPLLRRLADRHDEIAELVDLALTPE